MVTMPAISGSQEDPFQGLTRMSDFQRQCEARGRCCVGCRCAERIQWPRWPALVVLVGDSNDREAVRSLCNQSAVQLWPDPSSTDGTARWQSKQQSYYCDVAPSVRVANVFCERRNSRA